MALGRGGRGDDPLPHVNLGLVLVAGGDHAGARHELEQARGHWARAGSMGRAAAASVFLLPSLAALGDWEAWDASLADATRHLLHPPVVDPDLGWTAEEAGRHARAVGEFVRARAAYELARDQWVALGRAEEETRVADALRSLDAEGA